jgi:hypothetical protein
MPTTVPPPPDPLWARIILAPVYLQYSAARAVFALTRLTIEAGWAGRPGVRRHVVRTLAQLSLWAVKPLLRRW